MSEKDDVSIGERTRPTIEGDGEKFNWKLLLSLAVPTAAPVLRPKLHGNSCGPGSDGPPVDTIDQACYEHDKCYDAAGVNGYARFVDAGHLTLTPEQRESAAGCDAGFCEDLAKIEPESFKDKVDLKMMEEIFRCGPSELGRSGPDR